MFDKQETRHGDSTTHTHHTNQTVFPPADLVRYSNELRAEIVKSVRQEWAAGEGNLVRARVVSWDDPTKMQRTYTLAVDINGKKFTEDITIDKPFELTVPPVFSPYFTAARAMLADRVAKEAAKLVHARILGSVHL